MKFPYLKLRLDQPSAFFGNSILKPVIPVAVSFQGKDWRYAALIDSGADFSIFHAEIGEGLGIDIRSGMQIPFGGIQEGGGAHAFLHPVTLNIGGWKYETIIGFSYDIAKWGHGILGQKGFFDLFLVKFDFRKEEIELKEQK